LDRQACRYCAFMQGLFRVDMREKDGRICIIDVNPNPDLNIDSGLANQCKRSGLLTTPSSPT